MACGRPFNRLGVTETLKRSPFAQAREGMFALRDAVLDRGPVGLSRRIVFSYAVVMPDVMFTAKSPEWEAHQVIDRDTLRKPVCAAVKSLALEQRKLLNIHPTEKEPVHASIGILDTAPPSGLRGGCNTRYASRPDRGTPS